MYRPFYFSSRQNMLRKITLIRNKIQIQPNEVKNKNYPYLPLGDINIRDKEICVDLYSFIQ